MRIKSVERRVSYYDCDNNSRLRPSNILRYFAEISTRDLDKGFKNISKMDELGYGWMLARWKVSIDKYPKTGDKILMETWVSKVNKFYMHREYIIKDMDENILIKGSGLWIFIDTAKRKLIRLTDEFFDMDFIHDKSNFEDFYTFTDDDYRVESKLKVRRSDIDANQHVNNIKYLDWIMESVPEEIYLGHTISEFDIQYKKEIQYPAEVLIYSGCEDKSEYLELIHNIVKESSDKTNCFIKTKWKAIENK